jgi:photosystem II stability/assembly factor-like uncharacterized protein
MTSTVRLFASVPALCVFTAAAWAQLPESTLADLKPRAIGPAVMGGRTVDFAVYEPDPSLFYVASASGGLLKTVNGGTSWENVFDRQGSVSIGDVAINPSDPSVVWVGTGEANNRQSSSWGEGIYKSTDGGRSWKHMGLRETQHIGRIVINPYDTDIVYVAALGRLWGPNRERGVFMTADGGLRWEQVLAIDENTGAVDLAMDPSNPKVLYASAYQRRRSGWGFNGGGPKGGIYKTVDGGRSWRLLTAGLPTGDKGRIGLDIYRKDPNIVYAIIESREGGVFRSEDKGESWTRVNTLNPRPMYYSQIRIDPTEPQRIYVLGTQLHVSDDGGKTFRDDGAPGVHLDHHAFWINPQNPRHLITGNDGGVWVSRDRSRTWEHLNNYATGQFYHVSVDMQQPYWVYGGMQDNASWMGPSAVRDRVGILNHRWIQMLACDGMYVLVDPTDNNSIYTNCQNGRVVRYDRSTGERKAVMPRPAAGEPPLRWNWTSPIAFSPHDGKILYTGANKVMKSTDRGHTWTAISPDLTTQTDREQLELMGVVGRDVTLSKNDGMGSFGNITALAESPKRAGLLYAGTDDGNVQVSRDNGRNWANVTSRIPGVPKMIYVSRLTPSGFEDGTVYATFDGHRSDDQRPYVFASTDFGQTWKAIANNLPVGSVYTIKEDPTNQNLLYLGTEFGLYVSVDRGSVWTRWPTVPTVAVYDLVIHPRDHDLVLATHGRSFMVLDDVSPLQQASAVVLSSRSHLFKTRPATQFIPNETGWFVGGRDFIGPNPEFGAYINYYLGSAGEDVKLAITDAGGATVRELTGSGAAGIHRIAWDLRAAAVGPVPTGMYGDPDRTNAGPFVLPGEYTVTLSARGQKHTGTVRVLGDPLVAISDADRKRLFELLTAATSNQSSSDLTADAIGKLDLQVQAVAKVVREHSGATTEVKNAADRMLRQVADLRLRHIGTGGRGGGGGAGGGPLRNRIRSLKSELIASQSAPTANQMAQQEANMKDLNDLVAEVNAVINTAFPGLLKQLSGLGIYPVLGETIRTIPR